MSRGIRPDDHRFFLYHFVGEPETGAGSNLTACPFGARLESAHMASAIHQFPANFNKIATALRTENSSAWLRFVLATIGLTIAFAAAIFSTAASDAGNLLA